MYAVRLSKGFESRSCEITIHEEKRLLADTNTSTQMAIPAMPFTVNEVRDAIRVLNPKKAPGYVLISNQVLQKLPENGIRFITQLCNAVLRQGFFPPQWKIAQISMIQKPNRQSLPNRTGQSVYCLSYRNYLKNFYCHGF